MMMLGGLVFAAGLCSGTWLGLFVGVTRPRPDAAPAPLPPCPLFDDVPPAPPNLRLIERPFDWQRDGAA